MAVQEPKAKGLWWVAAAVGGLLAAERVWPKRVRTQAEPQRTLRNMALGAMSLGVVAVVQRPRAQALAARVERERLGLAQALPSPLARDLAAALLLDWTMYHWHVATHRLPLLWRLHRVHHGDADMDASTALRFHFVDMGISVGLRLAQVRLLGVGPRALRLWEGWFFGSVLFHHADLGLPFDARLAALVTTPGMHDIHHRNDAAALDSNFSAGLSVWDRLHGTFSDVKPDVAIGVPGPQGLVDALVMPFVTSVDHSGMAGDGPPPARG